MCAGNNDVHIIFLAGLIEARNLCWTFSLITHVSVSGSKTRTLNLPLGTGLILGFQPSRGLHSKVSPILVPFTLLLQVALWWIVFKHGLSADDTDVLPRSSHSLHHSVHCTCTLSKQTCTNRKRQRNAYYIIVFGMVGRDLFWDHRPENPDPTAYQ